MTLKYKVLIVEDDALIAEDISVMLKKEGFHVTGVAYSAEQSLQMLNANPPDIALLDISLSGKLDGIDLAEIINLKHKIPFLFITAFYDEKTVDRAKRTTPAGYIIKPFEERDLKIAIKLALFKSADVADIPTSETDKLFVKEKDSLLAIRHEEIDFVQSDDNYCHLHVASKKFIVHQTLKTMLEILKPSGFVQVHRSYLINFKKIDQLKDDSVFIGTSEVPMSRSFRKEILQVIQVL